MRVLVIGGTGFISGAAATRLAAEGHDLACFHRGERAGELPRGATRILGDRGEIERHAEALRAWNPDVVVDCVAFREADARALVETFRGVARRLVVLSSVDVYRAYGRFTRAEPGPPDPTPLDEDAPLRASRFPRRRWATPDDVMWDYEKILVERAVSRDPDLPCVVLRLPMVYGKGDHARRRVASYLDRMRARQSIELDAALAAWRWTRCFVDDVAEAIALAAARATESRVYNVGEPFALTELEWARAIGRAAAWEGDVVTRAIGLEDDYGHDLVLDTSRIQRELGWTARTPLHEALARTINP